MSRFYMVGVGPGDPELITLKAKRILEDVRCVFVPKAKEEGTSIALSIVEKIVDIRTKKIVEAHFPMVKTRQKEDELLLKWDGIAKDILRNLEREDVAFITLGDPSIYSTSFYVYQRLSILNPDIKTEIIPGVSSINAVSALSGMPLGIADEGIAIIPANYENMDRLKNIIKIFDTVVLLKVHRVLKDLIFILEDMNLINNAIYISRAGMNGQKIVRNLKEVSTDELDYFSIVIIKRKI